MITCPRCGYQAPDGTLYCPHCGYGRTSVQSQQIPSEPTPNYLITCPKCGLKLPPGSRFCSRCGYQFPDPAVKKKGFGFGAYVLIFIGALVILFGVVFIGILFSASKIDPSKTPTMSANQIMDAAQKTAFVLQTQTAAPKPTNTPKPDPTDDMPNYCRNMLNVWKYEAEYLEVSGDMTFSEYNHQKPHSCRYALSGKSGSGKMSLYLDNDFIPYQAVLTLDVTDKDDIDVLYGWAAAVASYLDLSTSTTIYREMTESITNPIMFKSYMAVVDVINNPVWQITIEKF